MENKEKHYSVALSIASSPALNRIWDLVSSYSPSETYRIVSEKTELKTQGFISSTYPGTPIEAAKRICDKCYAGDIQILDYWDSDYPALLKEIDKPPVVLYCKGNTKFSSERAIAIVGTRKTDKRSSEVCRRISSELSQAGFAITSGMAIGIDREAHLGALKSNSPTIGVLANGIDIVYPSYNRDVYNAIISSGKSCLISEYPPRVNAGKWTFVRRNRIISGLALGTIIVKAGEKSGALITAKYALEQNREVFACPGYAFDPAFSGCHNLINNGAVLVSSTNDILREMSTFDNRLSMFNNRSGVLRRESNAHADLFSESNTQKDAYDEDTTEGRILEMLSAGEVDIDSMVRMLDSSAGEVNEALVVLELSGAISRDGNMISRYL